MTPPTTNQRLVELARQGFAVLIQIVPAVLWAGLKRAIAGFFVMGLVGNAIAATIAGYFFAVNQPLPTWMIAVTLVVTPLSLSLAGAFVGGVRGMFGALATQLAERNLIAYLYAFVRPVLTRAAATLAQKGGPVTRTEVMQNLRRAAGERAKEALAQPDPNDTLGDKLDRKVAAKLQMLLVMAAISPDATGGDRGAAIADLESTGIQKVEAAMVDAISGLNDTQAVIAIAVAAGASALPYALYFLLS